MVTSVIAFLAVFCGDAVASPLSLFAEQEGALRPVPVLYPFKLPVLPAERHVFGNPHRHAVCRVPRPARFAHASEQLLIGESKPRNEIPSPG